MKAIQQVIAEQRALRMQEQKSLQALSTTRESSPRALALVNFSPKTFIERYGAGIGLALIERGDTIGQLALRNDIPTVADVVAQLGKNTAVDWAVLQIYKLEEAGTITLSTDAQDANRLRRETAAMIVALYGDWNLGELSLFFARFLVGEFTTITRDVFGAMKIYVALKAFSNTRVADVRRIERERATREYLDNWDAMNRRACSYEDYRKEAGL
jgi:hypothetical protein